MPSRLFLSKSSPCLILIQARRGFLEDGNNVVRRPVLTPQLRWHPFFWGGGAAAANLGCEDPRPGHAYHAPHCTLGFSVRIHGLVGGDTFLLL